MATEFDDVFTIHDQDFGYSMELDGRGGMDTLDLSGVGDGVTVDMCEISRINIAYEGIEYFILTGNDDDITTSSSVSVQGTDDVFCAVNDNEMVAFLPVACAV